MKEWLYGRNPVYETLRAGRRKYYQLNVAQGVEEKGRIKEIFRFCKERQVAVTQLPRVKLDKISQNHQGVVLQVGGFEYTSLEEIFELAQTRRQLPFILLLDTLQDPQNFGTLLRTAEAVGVHGVILPLRHTTTVTPAVVAASSGASEHLLITQSNLAQVISILKENEVWVVGLDAGKQSQLPENIALGGAIGLVVGSEGQGMRRLVRDSCDLLLRLPMRGHIKSLNASVAGSIVLYMAWQARGWEH
ncbi:MAG: 23S rRNA (guanosine(2251)-2'-O)-methyltransferase RlmB [Chloroflexi bacterium]|nr:23S rRNA (guanosine(2251)-2'-O)-methyltransferase RlmB [Chloroflexota bacterium]